MPQEYYFSEFGENVVHFTASQIREFVLEGRVAPDDWLYDRLRNADQGQNGLFDRNLGNQIQSG